MPAARYFPPVDTSEQKLRIETRLGSVKACKYFDLITKFLGLRISKHEFDRLCVAIVGRDNVHLHNHFIRSILKKACVSKIPLPRKRKLEGSLSVKTPNGYCSRRLSDQPFTTRVSSHQPCILSFFLLFPLVPTPLAVISHHELNRSDCMGRRSFYMVGLAQGRYRYQKINLQLLCKDFPQSPRKCRTPNLRDHRFQDHPSPLGPHGKNHNIAYEDSVPKIHEQQSTTDLHALGSRPPLSVEDGEEVDQNSGSPSIYSRSPVRAPLGIPIKTNRAKYCLGKGSASGTSTNTCQSIGHLPDTCSLITRLEQKCEMEGFKISTDSANLLNNALDVYLKRLMKPCLDLTVSKSVDKFSPLKPGLKRLPRSRYVKNPIESVSASISDFQAAMELNPVILGEDWPLHLEKVLLCVLEE